MSGRGNEKIRQFQKIAMMMTTRGTMTGNNLEFAFRIVQHDLTFLNCYQQSIKLSFDLSFFFEIPYPQKNFLSSIEFLSV